MSEAEPNEMPHQRRPTPAPALSARDAVTKALVETPSLDPVISMAVDDELSIIVKTADGKRLSVPTAEQIEKQFAAILAKLEGGL